MSANLAPSKDTKQYKPLHPFQVSFNRLPDRSVVRIIHSEIESLAVPASACVEFDGFDPERDSIKPDPQW